MLQQIGDYKFMRMQPDQIDEAAWLVVKQFVGFNPLWKDYNVPLELAFKFIRPKLLSPYMESDSLVLLDSSNKMVGCIIQQDMYTYIQESKKEKVKVQHELFDKLNKIEQELESDLFKQDFIKGDVMYGIYICIDQSVQNKKAGLLLTKLCYMFHQQKGIKLIYTRVTNPSSLKLFTQFKSDVVKQATVIRPDEANTPLTIFLIRNDFKFPVPKAML